mgnify:CR=1 FL=1
MEEVRERVFTVIQNYLKTPPVIIWGSGATVPFGLPSMNTLNQILKDNIKFYIFIRLVNFYLKHLQAYSRYPFKISILKILQLHYYQGYGDIEKIALLF